jgi:type II secretory pathway pseudopilin PulG
MVNWATALNCKRCAYLFQPAGTSVVAQTAALPPGVQNTIVEQNFSEPEYTPYPPEPQFQPTIAQPQISWGNDAPYNQSYNQNHGQNYNQSYNQNYNQNYGQNSYQPNYAANLPAANPKIGLAVTSMILGILAVLTTMFLIGILLAPIGLILGIVALVKAGKKPNQYGGKGFAIAGVAMSALMTLCIPIILAIAIPNLLAARKAANESSAIHVMQTLANAETDYRKGAGNGYCADLKTLIGSNLTGNELEKEEKNGYRFNVINYPLGGCEVTATPLTTSHGDRSFYFSTDDSLIRAGKKNGKPADKNDKLLADEYAAAAEEKTKSPLAVPLEGAAIQTLRTLQAAQMTYLATAGDGKCCGDFQTLANQGLVKPDLADGEDVGYRFQFNKSNGQNFEITATPVSSTSGGRSFFISSLDGLRGAAKNGLPADKHDPPVQ